MIKLKTYDKNIGEVQIDFFSDRKDFNESYEAFESDVYVVYSEPEDIYCDSADSIFMSNSKEALHSILYGTDSDMIIIEVFDDYLDACEWLCEYKNN